MKKYASLLEAAKDFGSAEGFLFDMDGVIFDTERLFMEQLAVVMADEGYLLSREVYCRTLGMSGESLARVMKAEYGPDYPLREISIRAREKVDIIAGTVGLQIKPQIPPLLAWLHEQAIKCAVVSSTDSRTVSKYLEGAGLRGYFSMIIGGEMARRPKPEPDIFLLACHECGLRPEQAVVLEDSESGVRAAAAAGIPVICVPDMKMPEERICRLAEAIVMA